MRTNTVASLIPDKDRALEGLEGGARFRWLVTPHTPHDTEERSAAAAPVRVQEEDEAQAGGGRGSRWRGKGKGALRRGFADWDDG